MINFAKKRSTKWWVGAVACSALFIVIIIYTYMKMMMIIYGVNIKANIKQNNDSTLAMIDGNARNATFVSLNGREITIDKKGNFQESLALPLGLSVITLNAEDKFGKETEKKFEVMYKEGVGVVAYNTK